MKKYFYILFPAVLVLVLMGGCEDTAGQLDQFSDGTPGVLINWVSKPKGDLKLSDPTAAISFEVEFIGGSSTGAVEAYEVVVSNSKKISGKTVKIEESLFTTSAFTANSDGNMGYTGSISIQSIATALGKDVTYFDEEDEFVFTPTVTSGGVLYKAGNASTFLDADGLFDKSIVVETVSITASSVKGPFIGDPNRFFLEFENDFTTELVTLPTVSVSSTGGNAYTVGVVQSMEDQKGVDSVYWVDITPPVTILDNDTVSIVVEDAAAVVGFPMKSDTLANAYILDYVPPTVVSNGSFYTKDDEGAIIGHNFFVPFDEKMSGAVITVHYDDVGIKDVKIKLPIEGVLFVHNYEWDQIKGPVTLSIEMKDLAGNPVSIPDVRFL